MSNISRRKFLKGAGVAALAVAAAGVLAGCSKDDIVDAYFYEKAVDGTENDIKIATFACYASQKTISKEKAKELAGDWCTVVGEGPFTIDWNNNVVRIEAKKNERIQILANQTGRPLLADAPFCVTVSFLGAGCSAPARCPRPAPRRS